MTDAHFAAAAAWRERAGGCNVIDAAFPHLAHHSREYVEETRRKAAEADVVVFSHPWVYPLVKDVLRPRAQLVVYDSHNVEGLLRLRLLGGTPFGTQIATHAAVIERDLCNAADLVLACSHEDRLLFNELYDVPFGKCLVVPNGTFTEDVSPADARQRAEAKTALELPAGPVAVFVASLYPPNVEAAQFIVNRMAPALPDVMFVICGGVGEAFERSGLPANVRITLVIDEQEKQRYLKAADLAVNPMFVGSGTNIKMFDFMAAGLPIVTTDVGARGIQPGSDRAFAIAAPQDFVETVRSVLVDEQMGSSMGSAGRRTVRDEVLVGAALTGARAPPAPPPQHAWTSEAGSERDRPHL